MHRCGDQAQPITSHGGGGLAAGLRHTLDEAHALHVQIGHVAAKLGHAAFETSGQQGLLARTDPPRPGPIDHGLEGFNPLIQGEQLAIV